MTARQYCKRKNRLLANGILIFFISVVIGSWKAVTNGSVAADGAKQESDWPAYGRDPGGSRYSPLSQINRGNVGQLKVAWTYRAGFADIKAASARKAAFEATPILADGLLYLTTPYSRVIRRLEPRDGHSTRK
jgi:glucose dehydrogenase